MKALLWDVDGTLAETERDGHRVAFNQAFEDFYGTTSEAMIGKTVFDIAPAHLAEVYDKADRELLARGGKHQAHVVQNRNNPERRDTRSPPPAGWMNPV